MVQADGSNKLRQGFLLLVLALTDFLPVSVQTKMSRANMRSKQEPDIVTCKMTIYLKMFNAK